MAKPDTVPVRCPHCAGPLSKDLEASSWTVGPLVRDSFSMIGSHGRYCKCFFWIQQCEQIGTAVGGTASAFFGFNHVMPVVRKWVKGPMWIHFLVGAPPVIVFSSACAGLAGGAVPALAQLVSSSCHSAMSSGFTRKSSQDDNNMQKSRSSSPL